MKSKSSHLSCAALLLFAVSVVCQNTIFAQAAPSQVLNQGPRIHGATPTPVADGSAQVSRHMDPAQMLRLTLTLQPVQQDDLQQFLRDVQDPQSSRFHQYLTFDEAKTRYAPSDASVAMAIGWAQRNGLKLVHQFRNNLAIKVEGDVATIEKAFDVQINQYTTSTRSFFSNDRDPAFPVELTGILKNVHGLSSYYHAHPASQQPNYAIEDAEPVYPSGPYMQTVTVQTSGKGHNSGSTSGQNQGTSASGSASPNFFAGKGWYEPADLYSSEAYDLIGLSRFNLCCNPTNDPSGPPKETAVAIIGSGQALSSDLTTFLNQYTDPMSITQYGFDGATSGNAASLEITGDLEWSSAFVNGHGLVANQAAFVYAYEGGNTKLSDLLDAWNHADSDDKARNASSSFGSDEGSVDSANMISDFTNVINDMAAKGWSIAVATGDHGATQDCSTLSVGFPASDPFVVAAGGTNLALTNNAGAAQYGSEHPWNGPGCNGNASANQGGGNGGCASIEPRGFYQEVFGPNLCGSDKRSLPDVALNSAVGEAVYYNGSWTGFAGTSIVSPELAGYFSQVNSYLLMLGNICGSNAPYNQPCAPLGQPNYWIWGAGWAGSISPSTPRNPVYDIVASSPFNSAVDCIGGDGGQGLAAPYCAANGYDQATGWGSFNMLRMAWNIAYDLGHGAFPDVNFTGPAANTWYNTDQTVNFTVTSPPVSGTSAAYGVAGNINRWDNSIDDSPNPGTPGSGSTYYDGPKTLASSGTLHLFFAGVGCHTAHVRGWDRVGLTTDDSTYGPLCFDNFPPVVVSYAPSPSPVWRATDVSVEVQTKDLPNPPNGSGLANPADADFFLNTSVPAGTETNNAYTGSHQFCDVATNCATAGPYGPYSVDKKPPSITITTPTNTQYIVKQPVAANYSCSDGGSGVQTCAGPVTSGSNIDTSSIGTKTFTVNSTDNVSNAASLSVNYDVTYRICLGYNPNNAFSGSAANITLQLCDYNGTNLSQKTIVVHATAVDGNPALAKSQGNVNPGNNFLFGPPSAPAAMYLYLLNTKGLSSGKHVLNFTVQGDPDPHTAPFTLK